MSMPSRADTRPLVLQVVKPVKEAPFFANDTAAGVFAGPQSQQSAGKARRRHALSPLIPADAVLRAVSPDAANCKGSMCLAVLAEQTLSAASLGDAAAWVVRDGSLLLATEPGAKDGIGTLALALKPGDVVALALDAREWPDHALVDAAVPEADAAALILRCELMQSSQAWSPLSSDSPNAKWVKTIFNEYGSHEEKL
eukprot:TRINITY_DN112393_c0_g1_i1.p1 TRINITY_DN112393_c0_g1~~TRINITY_DN112393_c0_g1_i1.p1  ORF type:complete len:223 (+),score=45.35 TRINITY_DN112393_c0_g1_i1:76-669(+)